MWLYDIYGLVQDCSNSSALALDLLQPGTKPSKYTHALNTHLLESYPENH